ncbi:MAG: hypothetical protein MZV65_24450 [Chromatiales bacterium]|nr:hypothetical protein [Chromatiales bacterium]
MDDDKTTAPPETEPEQVAPAPKPRRRRRLVWVAGSVPALVLTLAAGLGVLLGTQSGLRGGLDLAQRLAPETLSVGRVEGRVLDRLRLSDLDVEPAGAGSAHRHGRTRLVAARAPVRGARRQAAGGPRSGRGAGAQHRGGRRAADPARDRAAARCRGRRGEPGAIADPGDGRR